MLTRMQVARGALTEGIEFERENGGSWKRDAMSTVR